jgi:hypothetical protein
LRVLLLSALGGVALAATLLAVLGSSESSGARGFSCDNKPADVLLGEGETYVGDETPEVVVVTQGNTTVRAQTRRGSGADNTIRTKAGDDTVCAGFGDDNVAGGRNNDDLFGQFGSDVIRGRQDEDFIDGGTDNLGKGGFGDDDKCLGGKPAPDTDASHDTVTECERFSSAFLEDR